MKRAVFCCLLAPLALACGASVTTAESGSATGSSTGSGGGPASSSTASAGGAAGGSASCADAYIDVEGDGPTQHLTGSCPGTWGANISSHPVAFFNFGGGGIPKFTASLQVTGCLAANAKAPSLDLVVFSVDSQSPGTYFGSAQYVDASNASWFGTQKPADVMIAKITEVTGETVEGSFQGSVGGAGGVKMLSGTFRACKVQDLSAP